MNFSVYPYKRPHIEFQSKKILKNSGFPPENELSVS